MGVKLGLSAVEQNTDGGVCVCVWGRSGNERIWTL